MKKVVKSQIFREDPFRLEEERDRFARVGKTREFKALYSVKQNFILDSNSARFWDQKIKGKVGSADLDPVTKRKITFISNYLVNKVGRLLDIGFGYADLEKKLVKDRSALEIYGLDISEKAVRDASEMGIGIFKKGSILDVPFPADYFNVVTALDVLEHIRPDRIFRAYKEIDRILKRRGIFVVSVPLNEGLEEMVKMKRNPNGHLRAYTPNILRSELEISGFRIISEKYFYAFRSLYLIKSVLINFFPTNFRKPNLVVVVAQKK